MSSVLQDHSEQSVTSLVGGIVSDFQNLLTQQIQLTRSEVVKDLRGAKAAASILAAGGAIAYIGAILISFSLAFMIHWLASPPGTDLAKLPLWACLALVGVPLVAIGGILIYMGGKKLDSVKPLEVSAQSIKETIEWKTNQP